ncbi:MAG: ATP-binding cassette domain-containing protein [Nitrospirae bacterium]|nr:ATP-binding cassette domain-containing protein [Nitrospirota bacterium]
MTEKPLAIEVSNLTKRFGALTAVDNVSFNVSSGEFFGFLGPNGAGKTTLIRMLTTLLRPTEGRAVVASHDVEKEPGAVRYSIGVVPQAMTSDLDLTGWENMDIYGRFYGIPKKQRRERIAYLLETVGLSARAHDLVATYSGGMRRRLEIARVLVHRPAILFLDEPTLGLDPQSRRVVWEFIQKSRGEDSLTIFLTTHYMDEAEALCDRVAIIDYGRIIAIGSPDELKAQVPGNDIIILTTKGIPPDTEARIKVIPYVHNVKIEGDVIRVYVDKGAQNVADLIEKVKIIGVSIEAVEIHRQSLEDVFIHYTGRSIREEEAKKVSFLVGAGVPSKLR